MFYCLKSGTNSVVFGFAYSTANESTHESQHHQGQRRAQLTHQGRGRSGCWGGWTEKSPMKSPKWSILNASFSCVNTTCWRPRSRLLKMLLSWDVLYHNWTQSSCSLPQQTRGITCKSNNGRGKKKNIHSFWQFLTKKKYTLVLHTLDVLWKSKWIPPVLVSVHSSQVWSHVASVNCTDICRKPSLPSLLTAAGLAAATHLIVSTWCHPSAQSRNGFCHRHCMHPLPSR